MGLARRHLHHGVGGAVLAAALLLCAAVPGAMAQEGTENELEFSYVPGAPNGPDRWSTLEPSWANCSAGRMQSPIDLADNRVKQESSLGYLDYHYRPADASIVNRGHDIKIEFMGDAGRLVINGTVYNLKQLHWHTPSEHTIDGRRYDMELHLVHVSAQNKVAVIGILYEISILFPDLLMSILEPSIRDTKGKPADQPQPIPGKVDASLARPTGSVYYRYMGSLTTPPCTEAVIWTVVKKDRPVQERQVQLLKDAVADGYEKNARPLQAENNRDISVFRPWLGGI